MEDFSPIIKIDTGAGTVQIKEYEIFDFVDENSAILKTPALPFDFNAWDKYKGFSQTTNPVFLANSLFETMFKHKGFGLAAPQCGIPYAVFVIGGDPKTKQVMFNPIIVQESKETEVREEGCLSYSHLFVKVPRSKAIMVSWQAHDGSKQFGNFTGLTARIIQHEIEHLRGHPFWRLSGKTSLAMAREKRKKLQKKDLRKSK